ncbi:polymerase/histidinol phosphatase-like protein [Aspergillus granulosus]|uniref:Polymerase/histidinol phosphatase-like protein n=1 Tax=Aspergillus granulosus TaxID=176169 RepID=A0ABR4GVU6_9EURO
MLLTLCTLALSTLTSARTTLKKTLTGHIDPSEVFNFVYAPFTVEPGTTSISVLQTYSAKGNGNALDLGLFDQRGTNLSASRGWSGGFRNNFTITPSWATPGYNAGPIEPGTWNVVLGPYTSVPEGIDWSLDIEMGFDPVDSYFMVQSASVNLDPICNGLCTEDEQGRGKWLRGDLHIHTIYSDGRYTPEEQIRIAVNQGLDFIFFSDHNTDSSNNVMGSFQSLAPDLLIGRGIEVTTRAGHWQALGLDPQQLVEWRYQDGNSYTTAAHEVHRRGGLVSINHPFAECSACNWVFDSWESNDAIEVWNAAWDSTDAAAVSKWQNLLVEGKFTTAIGGSDSHSPPALNGIPTTVVQSRGKSQGGILEGIKAGRAYIVQGPGMEIEFKIQLPSLLGPRTVEIGDKVRASTVGAIATVKMRGFKGPTHKVCFVTEQGYVYNATIKGNKYGHGEVKRFVPVGSKFFRVEVRNGTDDAVLGIANPVWFL